MRWKLHWPNKTEFDIRLKEHHPGNKTGTQTDVTKHLLENPSHVINFNEPEILTTANHPRELLIKETLLIQQQLLPPMLTNHPHHSLFSIIDFIYACVFFFFIF